MKLKKRILALALTLSTITATAFAEHTAAGQYRQILQSGNFYVEYSIIPNDEQKGSSGVSMVYEGSGENRRTVIMGRNAIHTLASDKSRRISGFVKDASKSSKKGIGGIFGGGLGNIFGGKKNKNKQEVATNGKIRRPSAMFQNGKYYRFDPVDFNWFKENSSPAGALVVSEKELHTDTLSENEGWQYIVKDLALPETLSIFSWDDKYHVDKKTKAPIFSESKQITVDGKTYACDRYVADFKTQGGSVVAQDIYDLLYGDDGKLKEARKYFVYKGKETPIERIVVFQITGTPNPDVFVLPQVPVYAAGKGDVNEFLGRMVQVETIGGTSNEK